jgi:hypothetical protein
MRVPIYILIECSRLIVIKISFPILRVNERPFIDEE